MTPDQFTADKVWASMHFGICSNTPFADEELGDGSEDINTYFNPTDYDAFESWFDSIMQLVPQPKGVMLTTHYWEGFTLFPSATTPRSVNNTTWYAEFGRDPVADFVAQARKRGLKVGLYYNVTDFYYDALSVKPLNYTQWTQALLTELLDGRYGTIDLLFLDGWGDTFEGIGGRGFTDPVYATVLNTIDTLQPNCLTLVNNHETPLVHGDARLWERTSGEVTSEPAAGLVPGTYPALALHDTQHLPSVGVARWFNHPDKTAEAITDSAAPISRLFRTNYNGYVWFVNYSPSGTGQMVSDTVEMMKQVGYRPGEEIYSDVFDAESTPQNLESYNTNWQRTFTSDAGKHAVIDPSMYCWVNDANIVYRLQNTSFTDGKVELYGHIKTLPSSFEIFAARGANSDASSDDRMMMLVDGDDVTFWLAVVHNNVLTVPASGFFNNNVTPLLTDDSVFRLTIEKIGNSLRGEFWTYLGGTWIRQVKLFANSSSNGVGSAAFGLHSIGSATTGVGLTSLMATHEQTTNTPVPTIQHTTGATFAISYAPDLVIPTTVQKLYRASSDGRFYVLEYKTSPDNSRSFTDTELSGLPNGVYSYKVANITENWVQSADSNVVVLLKNGSVITPVGASQRNGIYGISLSLYG